MRTLLIVGLLVITTLGSGCFCSCRKGNTWTARDKVEVIDGQITAKKATPIEKVLADPEKYVGQTLLVEGVVTGRCQGSGCWVSLDSGDPENPFYAKSPDHSFAFPASCEQKRVWVEGVFNAQRARGAGHELHQPPRPGPADGPRVEAGFRHYNGLDDRRVHLVAIGGR